MKRRYEVEWAFSSVTISCVLRKRVFRVRLLIFSDQLLLLLLEEEEALEER